MGETKKTLKVRPSEHRQVVRRGDQKNGNAVHVQKTNHCINWKGATVWKSSRILAEKNCGGHPDQEDNSQHESGQWPHSTNGLENDPATYLLTINMPLWLTMLR